VWTDFKGLRTKRLLADFFVFRRQLKKCKNAFLKSEKKRKILILEHWCFPLFNLGIYKNLRYRRGTARCVVSVEILPTATQQCRNYLYDKSWTNRSYEVEGLRWADVINMCTQPWRVRVLSLSYRCHKQTDTVELCISPVYRRHGVAKFSKSTM